MAMAKLDGMVAELDGEKTSWRLQNSTATTRHGGGRARRRDRADVEEEAYTKYSLNTHSYGTRSIHLGVSKHKNYNMKVVRNDEAKLLLKENRKRSTMCDKIFKIPPKRFR